MDDTRDTPSLPKREFLVHEYAADIVVFRRITRALELRGHVAAMDANALDEVPDSTWFTNRIGRRDVTPQEAMRGSSSDPPQLPLVLTSVKQGGTNPGFIAADATGRKFVIKFDPADSMELQTAASVIVNRFGRDGRRDRGRAFGGSRCRLQVGMPCLGSHRFFVRSPRSPRTKNAFLAPPDLPSSL